MKAALTHASELGLSKEQIETIFSSGSAINPAENVTDHFTNSSADTADENDQTEDESQKSLPRGDTTTVFIDCPWPRCTQQFTDSDLLEGHLYKHPTTKLK